MAGDLMRRSISGFPLAGGLAALVLLAPDLAVQALLVVMLLLAAFEWAGLAGIQRRYLGPLALLPCLAVTWAWMEHITFGDFSFLSMIGLIWLYTIAELLRIERRGELDPILPLSCSFTAGLVIFSGMFGAGNYLLEVKPEDLGWLLPESIVGIDFARWLLAGVLTMGAFADIGAYFVGRKWGTILLSPVVSPGKTWQGFVGGLALGLLLPLTLVPFLPGRQLLILFAVCIALICLGLYGDLWESLAKRYRGVKDSGHLLSGHGGVLDRIDSHLCTLPMLAFLISLRALLS